MKNEKSGRNRPSLRACLLFALVITTAVTGVTFSKYASRSGVSDAARMATAVLSLGDIGDGVVTSLPPLYPGSAPAVYVFTVSNLSGDAISEVATSYVLTLSTTNNLPLTLSLSRAGMDSVTTQATAGTGIAQSISAAGDFPSVIETTHEYTLTVSWNAAATAHTYALELDALSLSVDWQQVD